MRPKVRKLILIAPFAILGMLVFTAIGGGVVMWLWNWLLPTLFGWPLLGFWQALGLLALCRILFGGFGHRGFGRSGARHRFGDRVRDRVAERVADRVGERWEAMTPEERERFRQLMRERFGFGPAGGGSPGQ